MCQTPAARASILRTPSPRGVIDMTDTTGSRVARHLGFLGYSTTGPGADGWWHAEHPRRFSIQFLPTPLGLRLHCGINVGDGSVPHDATWLRFVNRFNEVAIVGRAMLSRDAAGAGVLRVRALLPPAYERQLFGALLDAWHSDLDFVAQAPTEDDADRPTQASETIN